MDLFRWAAVAAFVAAAAFSVWSAAPAAAEDDDIYVAPLDEEGSDESLREQAGSGFDTPGPFYISEEDYEAGTPDDGTWDPDVPDVGDPEETDYGD